MTRSIAASAFVSTDKIGIALLNAMHFLGYVTVVAGFVEGYTSASPFYMAVAVVVGCEILSFSRAIGWRSIMCRVANVALRVLFALETSAIMEIWFGYAVPNMAVMMEATLVISTLAGYGYYHVLSLLQMSQDVRQHLACHMVKVCMIAMSAITVLQIFALRISE